MAMKLYTGRTHAAHNGYLQISHQQYIESTNVSTMRIELQKNEVQWEQQHNQCRVLLPLEGPEVKLLKSTTISL